MKETNEVKKNSEIAELRALTVKELEGKVLELRQLQFKLRMKKANGLLEKFHQFKTVRRKIAQIKTLITEKSGVAHGE